MKPVVALFASLLAAGAGDALAVEFKASGRASFGVAMRTQAADPSLLLGLNAAEVGLEGFALGGQNTDDPNLNYRRGDLVTRVLRGHLDLTATSGTASAMVRVKGWHDYGLRRDGRPWGNNPNGYVAGAPLSDEGAARLTRFSGLQLADVYVQDTLALGPWRMFGRLGRQTINWGERSTVGGGLAGLNVLDYAAWRRPGAVPQEFRIVQPMAFARLSHAASGLYAEVFHQSSFRPTLVDMCGTFWSSLDYLAEGCDRAYAGPPPLSDRLRLATGSYLKRLPNPTPVDSGQYGVAFIWKSPAPGTEVGFYHARYINRIPLPGLRKSSRAGPALIPGDPDGRNVAFFTEYVPGIKLYALNAMHKQGSLTWSGELAYRPNQPIQQPAGDVLPAFVNPAAPSLYRADASAVAPGALYHLYDRYRTSQLQAALQKDFGKVAGVGLAGTLELVFKHVSGLPEQSVRRYGRADQYGVGPVNGVCNATGPYAARQCSMDGYVTANAMGYRVRLDASFGKVLPRLDMNASVLFTHDVKGWAYDFLLNQGRRTVNTALRFEYRERYIAELSYLPMWGGRYNNSHDRDFASAMVGIKF